MAGRRIAVTGLGVISALGRDCAAFWSALCEGSAGFRPIESVDRTRLCARIGAEVRELDPAPSPIKGFKSADRFAQFALLAASEAVDDSGIEWTPALRARTAVITGSCLGGQTTEDRVFQEVYARNGKRIHPLSIARVMANAGATHISILFGTTGPAYTVATACSSSTHAIGQAFWMLRHGMADLAICGGSEAPFSLAHLMAWEAMRALSTDTCRPFSKYRRGIILGEGGAMLVLEPLDAARARGAQVYGEVIGFAMNSDACDVTEASVEGAADAMRASLADAGLDPAQIGYINAHGTGTASNDAMETKAIRAAFGAHADKLVVSSTKSMHGHTLGASGAMEAAATVLTLRDGIAPPTANFLEPDPDCNLDVAPNQSRRLQVEHALSNSFALGGLNAVLAFRKAC